MLLLGMWLAEVVSISVALLVLAGATVIFDDGVLLFVLLEK